MNFQSLLIPVPLNAVVTLEWFFFFMFLTHVLIKTPFVSVTFVAEVAFDRLVFVVLVESSSFVFFRAVKGFYFSRLFIRVIFLLVSTRLTVRFLVFFTA